MSAWGWSVSSIISAHVCVLVRRESSPLASRRRTRVWDICPIWGRRPKLNFVHGGGPGCRVVLDSMGHLPCFLYQSIRKGLIFDYARARATGLRKVGKQKPMDRLRQPFQQSLASRDFCPTIPAGTAELVCPGHPLIAHTACGRRRGAASISVRCCGSNALLRALQLLPNRSSGAHHDRRRGPPLSQSA